MKRLYTLLWILFFTIPVFAQNPQGFFLDDFQPKSITNPAFVEFAKPTQAGTTTVSVDFTDVVSPVSKYVFGNNANIYMTQMVDQPVLIDHIKTLSPNILRLNSMKVNS